MNDTLSYSYIEDRRGPPLEYYERRMGAEIGIPLFNELRGRKSPTVVEVVESSQPVFDRMLYGEPGRAIEHRVDVRLTAVRTRHVEFAKFDPVPVVKMKRKKKSKDRRSWFVKLVSESWKEAGEMMESIQ